MVVGQTASRKTMITEKALALFVDLSGDENPIHTDEEFAKASVFGQRIAPGLYVASFISAVLANDLPGAGTIYMGQELKFLRPVFIGDEIEARVVVKSFPRPDRAVMATDCYNQNGEIVIQGEALVKFA